MSDGTTAIQVSPVPTESEMSTFRAMFERAAQAIVDASHLGQRVNELSDQVASLRNQVETATRNNEYLAEQLTQARHERDDVRRELSDTSNAYAQARAEIASKADEIAVKDNTIANLRQAVANVEREADENMLRALKAEEELDKVKAMLNDAQAWYERVKAIMEPPAPETPALPAPTGDSPYKGETYGESQESNAVTEAPQDHGAPPSPEPYVPSWGSPEPQPQAATGTDGQRNW